MMVDLAAVQLTRRKVNAGIWVCAGLTMAASAISGITAFYYLQKDGWGIASGAMTALAVDVALWVVLNGDHLMEAIGISAGPWARTVRWGTAAMSITLNVTAAMVAEIPAVFKIPLVVLHAFVPLVMVSLAELRGEYAARLAPAEHHAIEEARARAVDTSIVAASERIPEVQPLLQVAPAPITVTPFSYSSPRPDVQSARPPADQRKPLQTTTQRRSDLRVSRPTTSTSARRSTPVRDAAFAWLAEHHSSEVTAAKLAANIGASPHTCKKLLGEWRRQEVAS